MGAHRQELAITSRSNGPEGERVQSIGLTYLVRDSVALSGDLGRSLVKAMVPLALGLLAGVIAGVLYAVFVPDTRIPDYFSSAAQVAAGVLVALVVELRADRDFGRASPLQRQTRVGILILAGIGCASSLAGTLVAGSTVTIAFLFGLSWGGSTAGVIGLFMLLLNRFDTSTDTSVSR